MTLSMPGWEPVAGGWLAPAECGWHLVPFNGDRPACDTCRRLSTHRITSDHNHRNDLYYPRSEESKCPPV